MTREDAKDLTLSILVVVVAVLVADCIWLHLKCARLEKATQAFERRMVELHAADDGSTFGERAKKAYDKVKAAAAAGYNAAKEEYAK